MKVAYLDTHVAVWLHDGLVNKLTQAAKREIDRLDLRISPMTYLEFEYLFRRNRIRIAPATLYANINATFGIALCQFPFPAVGLRATELNWTDDPFDRLIVAQALANQESPLITADEKMRTNYAHAVW